MVAFILIYCVAVLIKKFSVVVMDSIKNVVIFLIVAVAAYIFLNDFLFRIIKDGLTVDNVVFGFTGLICGLLAVGIALYSVIKSLKRAGKDKDLKSEATHPAAEKPSEHAVHTVGQKQTQEQTVPAPVAVEEKPSYLGQLLEHTRDNSLGMVIIYLVIAEFGIFSSKTIAASTAEAGLMVFIIFMAAALVFTKLVYHDYNTGLKHLGITFVLGLVLSLLLGYFWGGIPLDNLLSMNYFGSDALVALITGISLSLFMSSKG
jgi:hypothetical protein